MLLAHLVEDCAQSRLIEPQPESVFLRKSRDLCAKQPIQRLGRDPTEAHSGNQRHLRSNPSPKLSWPAHQLTGMEPGFSFGSRCVSHSVAYSAAASAHHAEVEPAESGAMCGE